MKRRIGNLLKCRITGKLALLVSADEPHTCKIEWLGVSTDPRIYYTKHGLMDYFKNLSEPWYGEED